MRSPIASPRRFAAVHTFVLASLACLCIGLPGRAAAQICVQSTGGSTVSTDTTGDKSATCA